MLYLQGEVVKQCGGNLVASNEILARYGGKIQAQEALSQSSYLSVNDSRLHFGLGPAAVVELEIRWPLGQVEKLSNVAADQLIYVTEGSGITGARKFRGSRT